MGSTEEDALGELDRKDDEEFMELVAQLPQVVREAALDRSEERRERYARLLIERGLRAEEKRGRMGL